MNTAPEAPRVVVETDPKGNVTAKVYGARTSFAYIDAPEIKVAPNGEKREKYRTQLLLPMTAPGVKDLIDAAQKIRATNGNAGKIAAIKNGDKEIQRLVEESGKNADDLQHLAGMAIISATSMRRPDIRGTDIYSGCYVAAGIRLSWFEVDGSKGVNAYLNAVVKRGEGERLGGSGGMSADDLGVEAVESDPLAGSGSGIPGPDDFGI